MSYPNTETIDDINEYLYSEYEIEDDDELARYISYSQTVPFHSNSENTFSLAYFYDSLIECLEPPEEEMSLDASLLYKNLTHNEIKERIKSLGYSEDKQLDLETVIGTIDPMIKENSNSVVTIPLPTTQLLELKVGPIVVSAYLDTGSPENLISLKIYKELVSKSMKASFPTNNFVSQIIPYEKTLWFRTISNSDKKISAEGTALIRFKLGSLTFFESFIVINDITHDIVLGRNFMRRTNMEISFHDSIIKLTPLLDQFTVCSVVIPPSSAQIIRKHMDKYEPKITMPNMSLDMHNDTEMPKPDNSFTKETPEVNIQTIQAELDQARDNVLLQLIEAIQLNQSVTIDETEGVTHDDDSYWKAINKIDLDKSLLNRTHRAELFDAIFRQRGALALKGQIGALKNFYFHIKMRDDAVVYSKDSYRMNPIKKYLMTEKIQELITKGIAQEHMSEYSSPALLIKKPSSKHIKDPFKAEYRMVIDLREMNKNAVHLQYALPIIHETITELDPTTNKYYSLVDISDAFYQILLHHSSYDYTTFRVTGIGSYCLSRLPQGYVGGPSIFQATIENLFPVEVKKYLTCYIDDILIMTPTIEKHIWVIEKVLYVLRQNGMKLKIEKCQICPRELDFLGITLCQNGIRRKDDKCEAIVNTKRPRTKKQVRSFLGAVGYYRRYIKNFAHIALPLIKLTKDNISNTCVPWGETEQKAFDTLKSKLIDAPILANINYDLPIIIRTDACGFGIGAQMVQPTPDGHERVVSYYSRVLQPHEMNYDITTKEGLAVLSAVRHYASYLRFHNNFTIQTDHKNLKYIFKGKKVNKDAKQECPRLIRWALYLSSFPGQIDFINGNSRPIRMADFLSRNDYEDDNDNLGTVARKLDPTESTLLEGECVDCSTDIYKKVSENTRKPNLPDIELLPEIKERIRNERVKRKILPPNIEIRNTDPQLELSPSSTKNHKEFVGLIEPTSLTNGLYSIDEVDETSPIDLVQMQHPLDPIHYDDDTPIKAPKDNQYLLIVSEQITNPKSLEELSSNSQLLPEDQIKYLNDTDNQLPSDIEHCISASEDSITLEGSFDFPESYFLNLPDDVEFKHQSENEIIEQNNHNDYFEEEPLPENLLKYMSERNIDINFDQSGNFTNVPVEEYDQELLKITPEEAAKYIPLANLADILPEYEVTQFSREELRKQQEQDHLGGHIIRFITEEIYPVERKPLEHIKFFADNYLIDNRDNLLYRIEYPAGGIVKDYCIRLLFLPEKMVPEVVNHEHLNGNHIGRDRLIAKLRQKFWFPNMGSRIDQVLNQCSICTRAKALRNPFRPTLKPRKLVTGPGQVWYLDHLGPIVLPEHKLKSVSFKTPSENFSKIRNKIKKRAIEKYILVMVDSYSQYVEMAVTKTCSAAETADHIMKHIVCNHSWPRSIVHDQGTAFTNKILDEISKKMTIKNYQTAAMNPRANGLAEAKVKATSIALCKYINEQGGKWQNWVPYIKYYMNITPTRANGVSPFIVQHNRFPNNPIDMALLSEYGDEEIIQTQTEYCANLMSKLKFIRTLVARSRMYYNQIMEDAYNAKVKLPGKGIIGDFCYLYSPYFSSYTKGIRRLNIPWKGPFIISDLSNDQRLVRLTRVSDFIESDKWIPIHRIKLTQFGLNPPSFPHIAGLSKEDASIYETLTKNDSIEELIAPNDLEQPWDNNNIDTKILILPDKSVMFMPIDGQMQDGDQSHKSKSQNTEDITFVCKLPPRIKTTRQGTADQGPVFKTVKKFYNFKIKDDIELVQISFQDQPGHRIWTNVSSVIPEDHSTAGKEVLSGIIMKLKNKGLVKNKN